MCKTIEDYLVRLKKELRGRDPALIQDALADAEEHLRTAQEDVLEREPDSSMTEVLSTLIEDYGRPAEVAAAYMEIEARVMPALAYPEKRPVRSFWASFLGVGADPRAWGSFLYMLLAGLTGCIYGMWVLLGASVSLVSLVLIIGIPITGLFFLSVRGIALLEGRIVEALLGIRMPRKPLFIRKGLGWMEKLKALITDFHTWKAFLYLNLQFPLGLLYFFLILTLFFMSLKCIIYPAWFWILGRPLITFDGGSTPFYPPLWSFPLVSLTGFIWFLSTLHLAKLIGGIHGRFAKSMLVRKEREENHL